MIGYTYPEPRVGSRYTGWIDAAQAAKQIRTDIKQAKGDGRIPGDVKVSVRCRKYAGGQAVDVALSGWNSEAVWYVEPNGHTEMSTAAKRVISAVEQIRGAYNRDASDAMTDYYDVTYYGTTSWSVYPWSE